jgi:Protein of unknown function (DUF3887)
LFKATVLWPWLGSRWSQKWLLSGLSGLLFVIAAAPTLAQAELSAPQTAVSQTNAQITEIAEQFVDLVTAGKFEQAQQLLNPRLREGWTIDQMQDDWTRLQRITGDYKRRTATRVIDSTLVLIDLEFEQAADNMFVIFDDQQQIQGVDFPLQIPRL